MRTYLLRRLLAYFPLLLLITLVAFALMHLAPGGPDALYGQNPYMSQEEREQLRANLGLDKPWPLQYLSWLGQIGQGQLGASYVTGRPIEEMVRERLPATLELMGSAFFLALVLSLFISLASALRRLTWIDHLFSVICFCGISLPVFWLGLMGLWFFSGYLGWLPSSGRYSLGVKPELSDYLRHLLLPSSVLAFYYMGEWSRYLRASLIEEVGKDYLRSARAKGLSVHGAFMRHALRNALLPFITILALHLPYLLTGAVITETIFAWPGMGRLYYEALLRQDYPVLMGIILLASTMVVFFNLMADMAYGWLDPRVSLGSKS